MPPLATVVGFAESVTVGGGVTLTVTLRVAPPQFTVNVVVALSGPTDSEPELALAPVQAPPLAVHEAAFVEDQVKITDAPCATVVALADNEAVGAGADVTFTVTL